MDAKPPVQGQQYEWGYDGRYRVWTVEHVPYGTFPAYAEGGPSRVAHTEWGVSYPRLSRFFSSPGVVAADDGKIELRATRFNGKDIERHPLDGTRYDTDDDAQRAAYDAGLIAYMVYVKDEARYGI